MSKQRDKNSLDAGATAAALGDNTKLDAAVQRWSPAELTVVAEALEENHLASARTIWFRLLRRVPRSDKKPRDLETLLERVARLLPLSGSSSEPETHAPAAAASTADDETATSLDAFLCMLDDLVPGGLDFSAQLADVVIETAGSADGQLAEAHLFLASLLDGRPFNASRLSKATCRRLLQMLSDLLPAAKSAAPQAECLREQMGLALIAASLPRAIDIRDKVQTHLRMPLSSAAALASAAFGGLSDKVAADTWLRSRFTIMADYAAYSMNPLNLPDQLLQFSVHPDDAVSQDQTGNFSGLESSSAESFMERYISSHATLFERMRLQDVEEMDEEFLHRVQAKPVKRAAADATPPVSGGKRRRLNITKPSVLPAAISNVRKELEKSEKQATAAKSLSTRKSPKAAQKVKKVAASTTKSSRRSSKRSSGQRPISDASSANCESEEGSSESPADTNCSKQQAAELSVVSLKTSGQQISPANNRQQKPKKTSCVIIRLNQQTPGATSAGPSSSANAGLSSVTSAGPPCDINSDKRHFSFAKAEAPGAKSGPPFGANAIPSNSAGSSSGANVRPHANSGPSSANSAGSVSAANAEPLSTANAGPSSDSNALTLSRRSARRSASYLAEEDSESSSNEEVTEKRDQQPVLMSGQRQNFHRQGQVKSNQKSISGVKSATGRMGRSSLTVTSDTVLVDPNRVNMKEFISHKSKDYVAVDPSTPSRPEHRALLKPLSPSVLAQYASQSRRRNSGGHPLLSVSCKRGRKIHKGTSAEDPATVMGTLYSGLAKPVGTRVNWTVNSTTVVQILPISTTEAGNTEAASK